MDYRTGIVLSGGGARGFAHAGALKALNEQGIYPEVLSGVSAGALAGTLYADGYKPDEILDIFLHIDLFKLLKFTGFRLGLLQPDGLRKVLENTLRAKKFEELKMPMVIGCTDIDLAETTYFSEGKILDALIASMAFPFLIKPQTIHGHQYVDGGLMNNLPVQPLVGRCERIIGIHVNPLHSAQSLKGTRNYFDHVIHLGLRANMLPHIGLCDMFIEPPDLGNYHLLKISSAKEIFQMGYDFTSKHLKNYPDLRPFQMP